MKTKTRLSAAEVKERTDEIFEPITLIRMDGEYYYFSVLGFDVWVLFFNPSSEYHLPASGWFPGTNIVSLEIFDKNDDCYVFYSRRYDTYKPKKGFPIKKIVKKIMKFRKKGGIGDLTS